MTLTARMDTRGAEPYFSRGQTYHDRAALEAGVDAKPWFDLAAADFERAVEKDPRHYLTLDMPGLVYEQTGEMDQAIVDYMRAFALNPQGRTRLADAYCTRGWSDHQAKKYDAAIADYEKAIEIGASNDGCSCDPYNPLITLYDNKRRRFDKGWEVVHKARHSHRWIAPEVLDQLK